jgi:hypothetical protein
MPTSGNTPWSLAGDPAILVAQETKISLPEWRRSARKSARLI